MNVTLRYFICIIGMRSVVSAYNKTEYKTNTGMTTLLYLTKYYGQ